MLSRCAIHARRCVAVRHYASLRSVVSHSRVFSTAAASTNASAAVVGRLRDFVPSDRPGPCWSLQQEYGSLSRGGGGGGGAAKIEPISPAELAHLAQLSHLSLPSTEAGRAALLSDVESVVEWVGTISALNHLDAQYAPMYTPLELPEYYAAAAARTTEQQAPSSDSKASNSSSPSSASVSAEDLSDPSRRDGVRLRPDVVADGGLEKQLLANASFKHRGFFVVPKVVDLEDS